MPGTSPGDGSRAGSLRPARSTARSCAAQVTPTSAARRSRDYSAHHDPFQYYASTANPAHLPPATEAEIGHNGQANHQYDLSYFYQSLTDGNLPAVSFVKAPRYQDGHAGYSDPIDEQTYLVNTINAIEQSQFWKSTAIIIAYDDSDGWYDQVMPPIVNSSTSVEDALSGTGQCGNGTPAGGFEDRCGYGQRLPLLVISPYARAELRRQRAHRHDLDPPLHRGQLVAATHRWRVIRCARRQHRRHVQLSPIGMRVR